MSAPATVYGIDFGTSNSLLCAATAQQVTPLVPLDPAAADPAVMRSLIYFDPNRQQWFGEAAIRQFTQQEMQGRFLRSFKRFLPIKSFEGTLIDGKLWQLEDLIARFLREMRERANRHLERDVDAVVLGRPALFAEDPEADRLAEDRLRAAATKAGFKSVEFLPEPVAAAYRFRLEMEREEIVLVADFGGGTSDFTLLKLSPRPFRPEDVLSIGGAPVAGDALDGSVMKNRVARNFGSEVRYQAPLSSNVLQMPKGLMGYLCSTAYINLLNSRENRDFLNRVRSWSLQKDDQRVMDQLTVLLENQLGFAIFESIEAAKRAISAQPSAQIVFEYPGIEVREKMSQKQFRDYTQAEVDKIFGALDTTLQKAGLRAADVDRVCCTGGTAKVARVRQELTSRFGEAKLEEFRNFTSIVEGLGERARQLLGD